MPSTIVNVKLNYQLIARLFGFILIIIGLAMLPSVLCASYIGDKACYQALMLTASITIFVGAVMAVSIRPEKSRFRSREGYIVVASCWLIASLVGAFPYMISGAVPNYIDAFFEATAGFTTTGCTIISDGMLPKPLILWKATSNWLGGMGILVFVISILPALGVNGQFIAYAESPGPILQKFSVRMSDTAKTLYISYFALSIMEFILLMVSGKMPAFDALINTMGSISTGGLAPHPDGIMHYDSLYVEIIIMVFTVLSSVNFLLYHQLASGKIKHLLDDIELRYFLSFIGIATVGAAAMMYFTGYASTLGEALRKGIFQTVSMATTSGYSGGDYFEWPVVATVLLVILMFCGGCAASTSGSIKVIRVMILFKLVARGFYKRLHPRSVVPVKVGGRPMTSSVVSDISVFVLVYMITFLGGALVLSLQNLDLESTLSTSLAMLSNVGLAFGEVGAAGHYDMFAPPLKLFMSALMIVGRLEIFPVIIIFTRNFWGRDR